jgi:hypothetical protein
VAERRRLGPLEEALRALVAWFDATETRGVIVGGVAASLLGRPRVTGDVDALVIVADEAWARFVADGAVHGIRPRRADAIAFARRSRVLLLRHQPSGIDLDVSLGLLPFEHELVSRARRRRVAGVALRLPTPEDLVVMKAVAHRARDLGDIEGIAAACPRLDRIRIRRLVREFADVLEMPEIVDDLERALGQTRRRTSRPPSRRLRRRR